MTGPIKHNVLILGDARMAFPVMKALARAGHSVFAGVSIYSNYMEWSRYLKDSFWHEPLESDPETPFERIRDWLMAHPEIDTIQPINEASIRFVTRYREFLESRAVLILPEQAVIDQATDKTGMFDLCREVDGPVAPYASVSSIADIKAELETIGYPFILKPSRVDAYVFGRKALIIKTPEDFKEHVPNWPDIHPELAMQQYVTGPRHSVIFSAHEGRLLGAVEIRADRTHENDGTGYTTYGITVEPNPVIRENVERIVEKMRYSYTGCLQYIVDPETGRITFMELNPRVSLARLSDCAGLPHAAWGLEMAHGGTPDGFDDPWGLPAGVEYVWTKGELSLLASLLKNGRISPGEFFGRLGRAVWDACRCHHAVFDPTDPAPAIGVYTNKLIRPVLKRWRKFTGFEP